MRPCAARSRSASRRPAAVAALTVVPARALGLGDRFGLVEPGYAADLVVLDETHHVTGVWAAGVRLS